jgi:putative phosphoserine phosphatase / 1-acylglycerol-3-phosphate O-acyltransferase
MVERHSAELCHVEAAVTDVNHRPRAAPRRNAGAPAPQGDARAASAATPAKTAPLAPAGGTRERHLRSSGSGPGESVQEITVQRRLPPALREIANSPEGPQVGAFFDLDGTLVSGYTAMVFAEDRYRRRQVGLNEVARTVALGALGLAGRATFADLIALGAAAWRGLPLAEMEAVAQRLFEDKIAARIYPEVRELVNAHRRRGHTVVLASSATLFQVKPTARFLSIGEVLCSHLEVEDGILTGGVLEPMMWGEGKARAVQEYAAEHGVDLQASWFYADGDEDEALMHLVGHPRPTNPGRRLAAVAKRRGWPIQRFSSRGGRGVDNLVRTAVGLGAASQAGALSFGVGLLRRDRRLGLDMALAHGADLLLACTQIDASVVGEEHLFARRPAVFIWNHRNNFDPLIVGKLVRGGYTGVGKKELARDPLFGVIGRLTDVVFVDRADHQSAMRSMAEVAGMAKRGISVLIAPEGTRSPDGSLQPFKKGAFRLAMSAGLPIVPLVLRNADVLGPRNATIPRPGAVDVVVLPPIETAGWKLGELDRHIAEVHQLFVDTLEDWPGTYT